MIRLALLRHGHTAWNRAGRVQGRTDIPLDAEAVAQLSSLRLPEDWQDAQLVSSPLQRAFETARLVTGRTPLTDPALIEMNWGDWEGARAAELAADPEKDHRHIEDWGWHYTPPNGESPQQVKNRLAPWLSGLKEDTVAVCHIGIMRVVLAMATGWNFDGPAPFVVKRNRLFVVTLHGAEMRLEPEQVRLLERQT